MGIITVLKDISRILAVGTLGISACGTEYIPQRTPAHSGNIALEIMLTEGSIGDREFTNDMWDALGTGTVTTPVGETEYAESIGFFKGSGEVVGDEARILYFSGSDTLFWRKIRFDPGMKFSTDTTYQTMPETDISLLGEIYSIDRVQFDTENKNISITLRSKEDIDHHIIFKDSDYESGRFTTRDSIVDGEMMKTGVVAIDAETDSSAVLTVKEIYYRDQIHPPDSISLESCSSARDVIDTKRLMSRNLDIQYVDLQRDTLDCTGGYKHPIIFVNE